MRLHGAIVVIMIDHIAPFSSANEINPVGWIYFPAQATNQDSLAHNALPLPLIVDWCITVLGVH